MKLIAVSKFVWRSRDYEIGAELEAEDVIAKRMIGEGLVKEAGSETSPEEEVKAPIEPAAKESKPKAETIGSAGDMADTPAVSKKKKSSKKKKK